MTRRMQPILTTVAVVITALGVGYFVGTQRNHTPPAAETTEGAAQDGRRVLYWHDPMVPGQKFDKPGKSPFMDMQLVPVYADEASDAGSVKIDPRVQQNLGVRLATVETGEIAPRIEVAGNVVWNERDQANVQTRAAGFVERLHVRATLDRVAQGATIAELYFPDWVAAQEEFLAIARMSGPDTAALREASKSRMRQLGMPEALIEQVISSGKVHARVAINAPIGGVITELGVREGMSVMAGATIARINGTGSVWVNAEVPEGFARVLRAGLPVEARLPDGERFAGRVQAILPEVASETRTVRARIELANRNNRLAAGMYVSIALGERARSVLRVPSEALIVTGTRSVVMRADGDGRFTPVEVRTGAEHAGMTEIREGLSAGDKVVISSQFLLDSEASLRASTTRLAPPAAAGAAEHETDAVFESLEGDTVMLSHPEIPALKWGAMTMGFAPPAGGWPASIQPGARVRIAFALQNGSMPRVLRVTPQAATDPHAGHKH